MSIVPRTVHNSKNNAQASLSIDEILNSSKALSAILQDFEFTEVFLHSKHHSKLHYEIPRHTPHSSHKRFVTWFNYQDIRGGQLQIDPNLLDQPNASSRIWFGLKWITTHTLFR